MSNRQAIIDLGSNTTRMLIIEVLNNGAFHLIEEDKESIRLSEQMQPGGDIGVPALKRAIDAVKFFKGICDYREVSKISAVATAAVREASNQKEFLSALTKETGVEFRVLSRQEEPYFGYLGVINSLPLHNGLILDLGGGSMELTAVENRKMASSVSIPYGSLSLTEHFLNTDKPTESQFKELESFIKDRLKEVSWLQSHEGNQIVGIGGTVRTIAKINQRMMDYPFDELHNYSMSPSEISSIYYRLKGTSLAERKAIPGLSRDRADIILGGIAAVNTLLKFLKVPILRVSSYGLRDGVFFHGHLKQPVVEDIEQFSVQNISRLFGVDEAHARKVTALSLSLFEQLRPVHGLRPGDKRILWAASMLHETGYYNDFGKRFNNTFYSIVDNNVFGFTHIENYKIALAAAYFGAGGIKNRSILQNVILNKDEIRSIKKLGVILALADSFDRSRRGLVSSMDCNISRNDIELKPRYNGDILIEAMTARSINGYFKKAFDHDLIIDYF